MQANTAIPKTSLTQILHQVGRPLNNAARNLVAKDGDPIYCVSSLPYQYLYPILNSFADNKYDFRKLWAEACAAVEGFYMGAEELQNTPIWQIDELALNHKRNQIVQKYIKDHPDTAACFIDRAMDSEDDALRLHVNRSLIEKNGLIARTNSPTTLVERPGYPPLNDQIKEIASRCRDNGIPKILLADSGFASGNTMLKICRFFENAGVEVVKVVGGVGSYPKSHELLQDYIPECVIWFDLERSGWVESRDFFLFLNSGTPVATVIGPDKYQIATRTLNNGVKIGFAVPYMAYGGRWFRLGDEHTIRRLARQCFDYTLRLYDALGQQMTIQQLATIYQNQGKLFLLPVDFGDLNGQYGTLDPSTPINSYLQEQFSKFLH